MCVVVYIYRFICGNLALYVEKLRKTTIFLQIFVYWQGCILCSSYRLIANSNFFTLKKSTTSSPQIGVESEFLLPKMGQSITEATIIQWHVAENESFEEGDVLLEVATDKVDNEVVAPAAGKLIKKLEQEEAVVPVEEAIAVVQFEATSDDASGQKQNDRAADSKAKPKKPSTNTSAKAKTTTSTTYTARSNMYVSPLIEQIARTHHISYEELARIPASGAEGRLRKSDVYTYIEEGRPAQFAQPVAAEPAGFRVPDLKFDKGTGTIIEMDRMRQMIADHMVYSKHTSPHVTAYVEADLTEMVNWRNAVKIPFQEKYNQRLTFTPLFVEAVAKAIVEFPNINASLDGKNIIVKDEVNIGMATALPTGNLIVPVVRNADKKDLLALATNTNALAEKARNNDLSGDEIKGGTFTISNVGTFGSLMGTPIINQPEVAILATGVIKKRAEVMETPEGDKIEIRSMMYLSLSFDHRVVDGYLAGSFLRRVADYMEAPRSKEEF